MIPNGGPEARAGVMAPRAFGDVIACDYLSWPQAERCLVNDSDICALAKMLCLGSHPRALVAYSTSAFWLGLGIISIGLLAAQMRIEVPSQTRIRG
jgi:hypothetical protein